MYVHICAYILMLLYIYVPETKKGGETSKKGEYRDRQHA